MDQVVAAAGENQTPLVVVDMISGGAVLLLAAAERRGIPVAYVTGLRMRRASQLYDGTVKTDPKDAWVLADYARRNLDRIRYQDHYPNPHRNRVIPTGSPTDPNSLPTPV